MLLCCSAVLLLLADVCWGGAGKCVRARFATAKTIGFCWHNRKRRFVGVSHGFMRIWNGDILLCVYIFGGCSELCDEIKSLISKSPWAAHIANILYARDAHSKRMRVRKHARMSACLGPERKVLWYHPRYIVVRDPTQHAQRERETTTTWCDVWCAREAYVRAC